MNAPRHRRPWPMKWIVLAIIVFIVPYTYLTLHFRKPGRAYEPYADNRDRVNTSRLLDAGYQRVALAVSHPADADTAATAVATTMVPGGLPEGLADSLVEVPHLPDSIDQVDAPEAASTAAPYVVRFRCTVADESLQIGSAYLYHRADRLVILPAAESLGGELVTRSRAAGVQLSIPAGILQPGTYTVTLVGTASSRQWTVQVH